MAFFMGFGLDSKFIERNRSWGNKSDKITIKIMIYCPLVSNQDYGLLSPRLRKATRRRTHVTRKRNADHVFISSFLASHQVYYEQTC